MEKMIREKINYYEQLIEQYKGEAKIHKEQGNMTMSSYLEGKASELRSVITDLLGLMMNV